MNPMTYAFGIAAALLALVAIIELMRRATLRERHAVWWLVGGVIALVVAIFPQTLTWAARLLGIAVPTNLVFFIAIGLLFLVSLQYGAELTRVGRARQWVLGQVFGHQRRQHGRRRTTAADRPQIRRDGADLLHQDRHRARAVEGRAPGDALK